MLDCSLEQSLRILFIFTLFRFYILLIIEKKVTFKLIGQRSKCDFLRFHRTVYDLLLHC